RGKEPLSEATRFFFRTILPLPLKQHLSRYICRVPGIVPRFWCKVGNLMSSLRQSLGQSVAPQPHILKILVVDDHEQVRKTICDLLRQEKSWQVICEAADGQEGVLASE